ncbi:MAG TPA: Crp/Fnr family transcriptional regulator [Steroidobacteraceae bacterium]|nr:Crp/Fnr family transcriptional regulator [Steroidobacteraceae bacterium]
MRNSHFIDALQAFADRAGMPLPNLDAALGAIRIVELNARDFAFREHEFHPFVYRVQRGLLKQFYTTEDGAEWIKSFTAEGDLFACAFALLKGSRTTFSSQAIEPCLVEQIDFGVFEQLASESVEWQKLLRHATEELALIKLQRERDLLTLSAEELFRAFVRRNPGLADRVPQKDLAAYLGVTAVGLSRIIKRTRSASPYRA